MSFGSEEAAARVAQIARYWSEDLDHRRPKPRYFAADSGRILDLFEYPEALLEGEEEFFDEVVEMWYEGF